jgi:hypothetical protein
LKNQNALPGSENVFLTVIEDGQKKVFFAKIEYLCKLAPISFSTPHKERRVRELVIELEPDFNVFLGELHPDQYVEGALLLDESSHEPGGAEPQEEK